jgi:hypothetical protein
MNGNPDFQGGSVDHYDYERSDTFVSDEIIQRQHDSATVPPTFPIAPNNLEMETDDDKKHDEAPNFSFFRILIACLLLTTTLAVGSALDAKDQCISREIYYLMELVDDDTVDASDMVIRDEIIDCVEMFNHVVIPVGGFTLVFGVLSLLAIYRHEGSIKKPEHLRPSHLSTLITLVMLLFVILGSWTYGIFSIMLRPKQLSAGNSQNPYNSLAAVDQMGYIGDNANLYYLSWMSEALIMSLVYQVGVDCNRLRRGFQGASHDSQDDDMASVQDHLQTILSCTSSRHMQPHYRTRRETWYQFMLRLRVRSGFWVAALCSTFALFISSAYLFNDVLIPVANEISGGEERSYKYRQICNILQASEELPSQLCLRTSFSVVSGGVAAVVCAAAIILHFLVRHKVADDLDRCSAIGLHLLPGSSSPSYTLIPLWSEFVLSFFLSLMLGFNALFVSGVQGPAFSVGNLYYASWLSFLLCLRICLGCLEELYDGETYGHNESNSYPSIGNNEDSKRQTSPENDKSDGSKSTISSSPIEQERPSRLRKYFFLSIFSTVCSASAYDAARNQEEELTGPQRYMILAPVVVASLSVIQFLMCLKRRLYVVVSHFFCGGVMSIICFCIWLGNIVITMHSEDSWAVNGIGEIEAANLYYFSWAAIMTAGLQMMSYIKPFMGEKGKDVMILVWAAIVKVCFVILGAAAHIWYKISSSCADEENEAGTVTFCSRTIFSMVVALTGVLMGCLVLLARILSFPSNNRVRIHFEAAISVFLVLFFGVSVALITGIGGPGQSVGDLYYSSWLAFWVCIGIGISCYDQIKIDEMEVEVQRCVDESETEYVNLE